MLLLLLCFQAFIIELLRIPSGSMHPTLQGNDNYATDDRVFVNKWTYGPRIPFTTTRLWQWNKPQRWDIAVFTAVEGTSEHGTLVKRIVGLPGETVTLLNGQLHVNGQPIPFPEHMPEEMWYASDQQIKQLIQTAPTLEQRNHLLSVRDQYPYLYGAPEIPEKTHIPEGHYWLLGDNTLNSLDGRIWGWVPEDHLLGPVFAIWWPINRWHDFTGFSNTWWGTLLLYAALPTLLLAIELRHRQKNRKNKPNP
jgi:signal peptidase I